MIKISTVVQDAKQILEREDVVAIQKLYGLAGNIYKVCYKKNIRDENRPSFNPLIVHIDSIDKLESIC
jgi:L-threonylcarbamoyladenylate synthase